MKLYTRILIALLAGAAAGVLANTGVARLRPVLLAIEPIGTAFIRLITMVVVPLVIASLLVGMASLGDIGRLGRIGSRTLLFFLITTVVAATIGLALALAIQPGLGLDPAVRDTLTAQFADAAARNVEVATARPGIVHILVDMIPTNPIGAAAETNLLQLILFTLIFGVAVSVLPEEKRRPVLAFFDGVNEAALVIIQWIMRLAPYAVFALIGAVVARFGWDLLQSLLVFCLVVIAGEVILAAGLYPLIIRFMVRMNPVRFYRLIAKVPLMAFSTSSSNATLPVSIETAEKELGVPKAIAGFVLPLGATINMNGSALFKAVATIFIAQVYGFPIGLPEHVTIVIASTLSAIAGVGVPGSGMVTILIVLNAVGMGHQAAAGVALVIGVDRILDMVRTTNNVVGDVICAAYIARVERERNDGPLLEVSH